MKNSLKYFKFFLRKFVKSYLIIILSLAVAFLLSIAFYPLFSWNFDYSWVKLLFSSMQGIKVVHGAIIILACIVSFVFTLEEADII